MKHLLIILSIILLSPPLFGQSSKYESVSQCVLQTMKENKLTGNDMFKIVKEECERSLGNSENKGKGNRGVLYMGLRDGKFSWYLEKWDGLESKDNKDYSKYEGEIKNGFPNGQGTYTSTDGQKYVGGIKNGFPNGQGILTSPDGTKHEGEYKDGKYNGQGTIIYSSGIKYVGEFKDGEMNGQGTLTFPDGDRYVGEFKDGKLNGQAISTFPDGGKFVGEYKDGKMWNGTLYKDGKSQYKYVNGK